MTVCQGSEADLPVERLWTKSGRALGPGVIVDGDGERRPGAGSVRHAVRKKFGRDARKRLSRMGRLPKSAGVSGSRSE